MRKCSLNSIKFLSESLYLLFYHSKMKTKSKDLNRRDTTPQLQLILSGIKTMFDDEFSTQDFELLNKIHEKRETKDLKTVLNKKKLSRFEMDELFLE
ncbi:hypothetical protein D6745_05510 [Candidatus Woesearchaeota archaeon]|nr:MAG: hypothetical protein D6745_05510 [Candidatus Woesearchaeota archaeon]